MRSYCALTAALCVSWLGLATPASAEEPATLIHVRNGTNRTLKFDLYVECQGAGIGKFDNAKEVAPGEVAVWRLPTGKRVAAPRGEHYRVGLVGADPRSGQSLAWGVVGGDGMLARERTTGVARHILVQAAGRF